jgi:hypothetical protein
MVQIIPNRSLVEGKIVSIRKSPDIDHFSVMEVLPFKTGAVEGFANLLEASTVNTMQIHVADVVQKEQGLKEGSKISAIVRKAPQKLFAIPDSVKVL